MGEGRSRSAVAAAVVVVLGRRGVEATLHPPEVELEQHHPPLEVDRGVGQASVWLRHLQSRKSQRTIEAARRAGTPDPSGLWLACTEECMRVEMCTVSVWLLHVWQSYMPVSVLAIQFRS